MSVGSAERSLLVGIPSWCEEENISRVTRMIDQALLRDGFQPDEVEIIVADNSSPDKTVELFLATDTAYPKQVLLSKDKGKGNNFAKLFDYYGRSGARCLMMIDADLEQVYGGWFKAYYNAVAENGADMCFPLYFRSWFDGNMTNQIMVPVLASLTRVPIRQPIAGEFAFSKRFAQYLLAQEWDDWVRGFGIDIFCGLTAIGENFRIEQVKLAGGKYHHQRSYSVEQLESEFDAKFNAVVGTLMKWCVKLRNTADQDYPVLPRAEIHAIEGKEFDYGYIKEGARNSFRYFEENPERQKLWPVIPDIYSLDDDTWTDILLTAYRSVEETGKVDELLFSEFRKLFYIRMVSALSKLNDENVEDAIGSLVRRLCNKLR